MTQSVTDFLLGGGSASAKFETVGQSIAGTITVTPQLRQQTDFATKKPLFWDDGQPKMQVVVTLATDQRDPSNPTDDGTRSVYIKGHMQQATRDALRQVGASGLEVGGHLTVTFTGTEKSDFGSDKKLYAVTYRSPSVQMPGGPQQPVQQMQQVPQVNTWDQQVQQQGPPPGWAAPAAVPPMQQPMQQVQQPIQQQLAPSAPAAAPQQPAVDPQVVAAFRNLPPDQQDALTKGQPALRAALGLPAA